MQRYLPVKDMHTHAQESESTVSINLTSQSKLQSIHSKADENTANNLDDDDPEDENDAIGPLDVDRMTSPR